MIPLVAVVGLDLNADAMTNAAVPQMSTEAATSRAVSSAVAQRAGTPLLAAKNLAVTFAAKLKPGAGSTVIHGIDLGVGRGEILGPVGESGSGRSLTALAVLGMLPPQVRHSNGQMVLMAWTDDSKH